MPCLASLTPHPNAFEPGCYQDCFYILEKLTSGRCELMMRDSITIFAEAEELSEGLASSVTRLVFKLLKSALLPFREINHF